MSSVRVSSVTKGSYVNGPGRRNVLHLQGCSIKCKGCFNPHTWKKSGGEDRRWHAVYTELTSDNPDGITISGGEPMEQWVPVYQILCLTKAMNAGINRLMFTGLSLAELEEHDGWGKMRDVLDLVVAGPYVKELHCEEPLRGSSNQELIFLSDKITEEDLEDLPQVEVHLDDDLVTVAGFPSKDLRYELNKEIKG
tara:strand:- start:10613 stop:11197 length:585 start_codon:yes stop_codon:yes gene_type:complete